MKIQNILCLLLLFVVNAKAQKNATTNKIRFPEDFNSSFKTTVCAEKMPKIGKYNNLLSIFSKKTITTASTQKFELSKEKDIWKIKTTYFNNKKKKDVTFTVKHFDGSYAILDFDTHIRFLIDVRLQKIMAITPLNCISMKFPRFDEIYYLDSDLFVIGALKVGNLDIGDSGGTGNLYLYRYKRENNSIFKEHLSYKFDKNLYQLNYKKIIDYGEIIKNDKLQILKKEEVVQKQDRDLFYNVPFYF